MIQSPVEEITVVASHLCAGLRDAELLLTPSHEGLLHLPGADALPADLRPHLATEADALTWLRANLELIPRVAAACAAHRLPALAFEVGHRSWPAMLRLGLNRRPLLELMLDAGRELAEPGFIAMAQTGRASVLRADRSFPEALAAAEEAAEIYAHLGDLRGRGQAANSRGKTLLAMGRAEAAWDELNRAKALRERAGYHRGVGLSLLALGDAALDLGQPDVALEHFEAAREVLLVTLPAKGLAPDPYDAAIAAIGAAKARGRLGQNAAALEELALAEETMQARGSERGRALAAEAAGGVHEHACDPRAAAAAYRKALALYQDIDASGAGRVAARLAGLGQSA